MALEIDEGTKALIREAFAGEVCRVCGFQAQRLRSGRFYCADCLPTGTGHRHGREPAEVREARYLTVRRARAPRSAGHFGSSLNKREDL